MTLPCMKRDNEERRISKDLDRKMAEWNKEYRQAIKLLLLGTGESGKTTIITQMRILHISGFSDSERIERVKDIRQNVHEAIYELVTHLTLLKPPIDLDDDDSESSAQFILAVGKNEPDIYTKEYFEHVLRLWYDLGIKECYLRSNEFQLIDSAKYFLDKIDDICQSDYIPDDQDILRCRKRTSAIQKIEFSMNVPKKYGGGMQEFWMFDVGGQRGERRKWIQVFEGIQVILFLVASSDFDQTLREDQNMNRLQESISLFDDVWNSRFLQEAGFITFLNKQDTLREKVQNGKDIGKYFPAYGQYELDSREGCPYNEYMRTRCFIRDMFVNITKCHPRKETDHNLDSAGLSAAAEDSTKTRECYFHFTVATDTENVKTVFEDIHSMVLTWNLEKIGLN